MQTFAAANGQQVTFSVVFLDGGDCCEVPATEANNRESYRKRGCVPGHGSNISGHPFTLKRFVIKETAEKSAIYSY